MDKLLSHLEYLYSVNVDLDARVKNLTADADTIAVYAHELGFVSEGERLIKLAGFSGGVDRKLSAGFPVKVNPPVFLPEWICKVFGLSGAALAFFLLRVHGKRGTCRGFAAQTAKSDRLGSACPPREKGEGGCLQTCRGIGKDN